MFELPDTLSHVPPQRSHHAQAERFTSVRATVASRFSEDLNHPNPRGIRETVKQVHDGAIGEIVAMQATANRPPLWHRGRKPEWTEMDFQIRNWYYFAWLSGDFNVEQHVHSLDKCSWVMHDEPPVSAWALSGRQVRTDSKWGDIFDHHAVVYEYANGKRMYAFTRQQSGCYNEYSEVILGTWWCSPRRAGRLELNQG